jgi:predicted transcriptional regulator
MAISLQKLKARLLAISKVKAEYDALAPEFENSAELSGIKHAIASLDRGEGIPHESVKDWVGSWGGANEKPAPKGR